MIQRISPSGKITRFAGGVAALEAAANQTLVAAASASESTSATFAAAAAAVAASLTAEGDGSLQYATFKDPYSIACDLAGHVVVTDSVDSSTLRPEGAPDDGPDGGVNFDTTLIRMIHPELGVVTSLKLIDATCPVGVLFRREAGSVLLTWRWIMTSSLPGPMAQSTSVVSVVLIMWKVLAYVKRVIVVPRTK